MADFEKNNLSELERYLNCDLDTIEVVEKEFDTEINRIRYYCEKTLLYLIIDESGSMYSKGIEKRVDDTLGVIKRILNSSSTQCKTIQTAITFFGSTIDIVPFRYGEDIEFLYTANKCESRLYDAIVCSCDFMIRQYDMIDSEFKVKAFMFIFTDGIDSGSVDYNVKDAKNAMEELKRRNIPFYIVSFDGIDASKLYNDLEVKPITIKNEYDLKRLMRFVSERTL